MLIDYYEQNNYKKLEEKYEIDFDDKQLLVKAFTHPSFAPENNHNYQRLEFLGDSVLQMVMSDYLYRTMPDYKEGEMSKTRAKLVSEYSLASIMRKNGLDKFILVGKSVLNDNEDFADSFVADVFESLVAAIYLDQGYLKAESFIKLLIIDNIDFLLSQDRIIDYKTRLQEVLQVNGTILIKYKSHKIESGFEAHVILEESIIGTGVGKSKKLAEQQAAKCALNSRL